MHRETEDKRIMRDAVTTFEKSEGRVGRKRVTVYITVKWIFFLYQEYCTRERDELAEASPEKREHQPR